jgi:hypothetical protein
VLNVPRYDFHWQLAYDLEQPLELPAGSKLIVTAHYDNSAASYAARSRGIEDPERNCGPNKVAYFRTQNQSWDEMFSPLVQYSVERAAPAQGAQGAGGATPPQRKRLDLVEVAGCLEPGSRGDWRLERAGAASPAASQATSSVALAAASSRPLGSGRYELLGASVFDPTSAANRKVVVRGVLIRSAGASRLNITSLQPVAGECR